MRSLVAVQAERVLLQMTADPLLSHQGLQGLTRLIAAHDPQQVHLSAERSHVHGDVRGPAEARLDAGHMDHRYRGLGGDTRGRTRPVPVKHHITGHEHPRLVERGNREPHGCTCVCAFPADDRTPSADARNAW